MLKKRKGFEVKIEFRRWYEIRFIFIKKVKVFKKLKQYY